MLNLDYSYIDHNDKLKPLIDIISINNVIALDTEADSMHHYYQRLCLLQFSIAGTHWLVDPLSENLDINTLLDAIKEKLIIFHGGDYDLRMLWEHYSFQPNHIYDTMLAGQLLGEQKLGLTNLVEKYFGVKLAKTQQKADWTQRPLPEVMCQYAATDTYYLHELYMLQKNKLEELNRLEWLEESCDNLLVSTQITSDPVVDPWRIKGSSRLKSKELAILRSVWAWREKMAEKWDRPPYKVISPQVMLTCINRVAHSKSTQNQEKRIDLLPRLPRNFRNETLNTFLDALYLPLSDDPKSWPKAKINKNKPCISPDVELLDKIKSYRDKIAEDLGINPTLISNRLQLISLAHKDHDKISIMKWQYNLLKPILKD